MGGFKQNKKWTDGFIHRSSDPSQPDGGMDKKNDFINYIFIDFLDKLDHLKHIIFLSTNCRFERIFLIAEHENVLIYKI